ncbi:MAG: PD-(D/E)XK nuclease family transposase, partial [Acidobacteriota bacterium]|nr:PD-(D/E)XK nuclease family transposase [Acidobacteriota bacterium]
LLEIHVLEMPKLPPSPDVYLWNWLRFLCAETKEELNMTTQASPMIHKAVARVLELSEDERFRMLEDAREMEHMDNSCRLRDAIQKGQQEKARAIARKMLKRNRPIDEIMEDTGLTHEEIEKLR